MTLTTALADDDSVVELDRRLAGLPGLDLSRNEPLAPRSTLRIGGPAQRFARVGTEAALTRLMAEVSDLGIAFRLLGLGSNVLLPDEGLVGVTAVLEGEFLSASFRQREVEAGGGLALAKLARQAVERGLSGLEALAGFPSTVGGAVVMNAGCYGVEIKDVLISAAVVNPDGSRAVVSVQELQPDYRSTRLQGTGTIVTRARFRLQAADGAELLDRMNELNRRRRGSMPSGKPNAGSVFRNPAGDFAGRLIEACGLKGRKQGGAEISPVHANVIVNNGGATASEVLELMLIVRRRVRDRFSVLLEPELILIGSLGERWRESTRGS